MRKRFFLLFLFVSVLTNIHAQQVENTERRLVHASRAFFVPHWYIDIKGGAAYDIGEAKFSELISPAVQLTAGYQFDELFSLRGGVSGLWARNRYA